MVTGPGWIAVGDAAMSWDPLSSLGIYKALDSGLRALESVAGALRQNTSCAKYTDWSDNVFRHYMVLRNKTYKEQRRWPGSQFWKRRK